MTTNGRTLDNRYIVRQEIGSGGFGAVYLAEDTRFTGNNRVAIKKIAQRNEETAKGFRHEANLLYNLSHPNLPKVTNCFQEADSNFIVMDYIAGKDLMARLKNGEQFAVKEVLDIADKVLDALEYLHSFLIFHRDIKPHNIKIDENGRVFLLDFGTAKGQIDESTLSLTDQSITGFTPFYAPLEQVLRVDANSYLLLRSIESPQLEKFERNKTDARSDIYSLGATLYHLLTGFSPERATATIRAHLIWSGKSDPLPDCRNYNLEISAALAKILDRCLAIDPEDRFQTAAQLRAELKNLPTAEAAPEKKSDDSDIINPTQPSPFIDFDFDVKSTQKKLPINAPPIAPIISASPSGKSVIKPMLYVGLPILFLIVAATGIWLAWRGSAETANKPSVASQPRVAAKQRSFYYSLFVQKMRGGRKYEQPFESSGQEIFEKDYEFQLNFIAPAAGFLYVFNEGLNDKGEKVFTVQFPTPSVNGGAAAISGNQNYLSSQSKFDGKPGTENFWLAWNTTQIETLEKARADAFDNRGIVTGDDIKSELKNYLENERSTTAKVSKDAEKKLTRIDFEGDEIVYLMQLEHR